MGRGFQLGKLFGIPLRLDYSWFLIFLLVTVSLAYFYFPESYPTWRSEVYWIVGICTSLLFFGSVLAHELAHSAVAIRSGIPVKSITLFIFGGVAHIGREATNPGTELKVAAAGPTCSVALAAVFFGISWLSGGFSIHLAALTFWLAMINGMLAAFNMIPGFPLDGGRVLRSILWMSSGNFRRATRIATLTGYGTSYAFIIGGILLLLFLGRLDGLWFVFIGLFLNSAARSTYQQTMVREALRGFAARDVMTQDCPTVPHNTTIKELVQRQPMLSSPCFLITIEGKVEGALTLPQLKGVPRENWDLTTISHVMTPVEKLEVVRPSDEAIAILEQMDEKNLDVVTVVGEGRVLGMVLRHNLIQLAHRLESLRG
jgi:Zn-dependent protease